jgi:hypothetical protein
VRAKKNTRTPWSTVNHYRFRKLSRGWLREETVRMRARIFVTSLACTAALVSIQSFAQTPAGNGLRDPPTFASIGDQGARSRAIFTEAAKVITSPRCLNCHPAGDRPTQGNDLHVHMPPVTRGDVGMGVAGNTGSACHKGVNFRLNLRRKLRSKSRSVRNTSADFIGMVGKAARAVYNKVPSELKMAPRARMLKSVGITAVLGGILVLLAEAVLLAALMVMAGMCALGSMIGWLVGTLSLAKR